MIVVTGGAGFIGSQLIYYLNKKNANDIILVDRLGKDATQDPKWKNLNSLAFFDMMDADDFLKGIKEDSLPFQITEIYHMGACSNTLENNVEFLFKNNYEYSKTLFHYAIQNKVKFIYASSAATYGAGLDGYEDCPEKMPTLKPLNPYGFSKQIFDKYVLNQFKIKSIDSLVIGLKFFNVFGPNEEHKGEMRSVILKAYEQIKKTKQMKLFKSHRSDFLDGEQKRDFIFVKDVCLAMIELMKFENSKFNGIGLGKATSFKELIECTFKALKRPIQIEYIDMPESIQGQYQYFTQADMKRLHAILPDFKWTDIPNAVSEYVAEIMNRDKANEFNSSKNN